MFGKFFERFTERRARRDLLACLKIGGFEIVGKEIRRNFFPKFFEIFVRVNFFINALAPFVGNILKFFASRSEIINHVLRNVKEFVAGQSEFFFRRFYFFGRKRRAVRRMVAFARCRAFRHYGSADNDCRFFVLAFRLLNCVNYFVVIVSVNLDYVPTETFENGGDVRTVRARSVSGNLRVVFIVKHNQFAQSPVTGKFSRAESNRLLQIAVARQKKSVVINYVVA